MTATGRKIWSTSGGVGTKSITQKAVESKYGNLNERGGKARAALGPVWSSSSHPVDAEPKERKKIDG